MKNWIRIFLVSSVLVGGTAFFAYQSLNLFNNALGNLSSLALIPFSDKTNREQTASSATSADLNFSFVFPEKSNDNFYVDCTYQFSLQSSTTIDSLKTALISAGAVRAIGPIASGLAKENKIEPNAQSLDWKVGVVRPGEYYIKVSSMNGVELENYSNVFTISKMPKDTSIGAREKICKESGGLL